MVVLLPGLVYYYNIDRHLYKYLIPKKKFELSVL